MVGEIVRTGVISDHSGELFHEMVDEVARAGVASDGSWITTGSAKLASSGGGTVIGSAKAAASRASCSSRFAVACTILPEPCADGHMAAEAEAHSVDG